MKNDNKLQQLVNFLTTKFSYSLLSIIKHDSDILHEENRSCFNLLIIMKDNFDFQKFYKELTEAKNIHKIFLKTDILILKQKEVSDSCDIFPIEYLEMMDSEEVLYGKKLADLIKVETTNLRLQIESNMRRNTILLKNAFIYDNNNLLKVIEASVNNFLISLKNLLRMHEVPVKEMTARDILIKTADIIELDIQFFFLLIRIIDSPKILKTDKINLENIYYKYLEQIENIVTFVDKLDLALKKPVISKKVTNVSAHTKKNAKNTK